MPYIPSEVFYALVLVAVLGYGGWRYGQWLDDPEVDTEGPPRCYYCGAPLDDDAEYCSKICAINAEGDR